MADTVIENLVSRLTFDYDKESLENFDKFLTKAAKGLATIVVGASAAAAGIFAFTKAIAESNDEIGKFAQRTGVGIEALQELGYVAELNGGSINSMNSSLENLSRIASEAARGVGGGVEVFGMLGISVADSNGRLKEADVLLDNVSDAISRLGSQSRRLEFAQKLGIGGDLLLSIQQGSKAIRQQRQEARDLGFVIGEKDAKAAADFVDGMLRIKRVFSGIASTIGTKLMKQMVPAMEAFTDWFKINKKLIRQNLNVFLEKASKSFRTVWNVGVRVVSMITSLVNAMGGWKNSIIAVTGLLVAMNASALLTPLLAIAAGIGILLILEDIIKFAEGGDSAIGALAKKMPVLDKLLRGTINLIAQARDGWVLLLTDGDKAFEGLMMAIRDARKESIALDYAIKGISITLGKISEGWRLIFTDGDKALEGLMMMIRDLIKAIPGLEKVMTKSFDLIIDSLLLVEKGFKVIAGQGDMSFKSLVQSAKSFNTKIANAVLAPIKLIREGLSYLSNKGVEAFGLLIEKAKSLGKTIKDYVMSPIDKFIEIVDRITGKQDAPAPARVGAINSIAESISRAQSAGLTTASMANVTNAQRTNNSTVNNTKNAPVININVIGGDSNQIKQVVADVLNEQYAGAQTNLESQVDF